MVFHSEITAERLPYIIIFGIGQLHAELTPGCQLSSRNIQRYIPYRCIHFLGNRVIFIIPRCSYRQKKHIHHRYFRICTLNVQRDLSAVRGHYP